MAQDTLNPVTAQKVETNAGIVGKMSRTASVSAPPMITPMKPPTAHRVIASIVNCSRIVRLVAPMALRTPISRVRSVTETSMMFMTPTPPTIRPTLATPIMKMKMPPVS